MATSISADTPPARDRASTKVADGGRKNWPGESDRARDVHLDVHHNFDDGLRIEFAITLLQEPPDVGGLHPDHADRAQEGKKDFTTRIDDTLAGGFPQFCSRPRIDGDDHLVARLYPRPSYPWEVHHPLRTFHRTTRGAAPDEKREDEGTRGRTAGFHHGFRGPVEASFDGFTRIV